MENLMTISLSGKLRVKRINGSNGPFCVGDLETEIGEFRVKDAVLDQFDDGLYDGQFWIQQIYPWSYLSYGRMVVEIRAKLADLQIEGHARLNADSRDLVEPDPAKEESPPPVAPEFVDPPKLKPEAAKRQRPAPRQAAPASTDAADQALFGEMFDAVVERQAVKLDPTIDRIQFRLQRDRLKALGYTFNASSQSWIFNQA
jgi:hypothetical protein